MAMTESSQEEHVDINGKTVQDKLIAAANPALV
jgi:hypothetical protein